MLAILPTSDQRIQGLFLVACNLVCLGDDFPNKGNLTVGSSAPRHLQPLLSARGRPLCETYQDGQSVGGCRGGTSARECRCLLELPRQLGIQVCFDRTWNLRPDQWYLEFLLVSPCWLHFVAFGETRIHILPFSGSGVRLIVVHKASCASLRPWVWCRCCCAEVMGPFFWWRCCG